MGHLLLLLLLPLLLASTRTAAANAVFAEEKGMAGVRGVIGSRPPSCEGRCRSCGRCEAVQVPISPQQMQGKGRGGDDDPRKKKRLVAGHGSSAAMPLPLPSSYDDHSNYKPLSWRCKCGGSILNP